MAEWITPIYDRTEEDVIFATKQIAKWIEQVITGNGTIVYDLRGCLNLKDINRIENNIRYLSDKLTGYGYKLNVATKQWDIDGIPNETDIDRITNNVRSMVEDFCRHTKAPEVPKNMDSYTDINSIEYNLVLIKELLEYMVECFKSSGTFNAGQTFILPIRR